MADTTKQQADQSFFVFVKDTNTGRIRRMAIPADVQIGLQDNPAELQLLGRLSLAARDYSITSANQGILFVANDDTIISVSLVNTPSSGRITLYLPANPRNGQLHFVKDMTGTADSVPIDVVPSPGAMIDQFASRTLTDKFGSIALYWFGDRWRILVSGLGLVNIGAADAAATYVTLSGNATLTNERRLNVSGTNLTMVDQGPNASVILDLSTILGGGAGTFTYATVTADAFGRITAISAGAAPPPAGASYITVTNEPGLSAERALVAGTGILLQDGGANTGITASVDNSVVATLTGSNFTGRVTFADGVSGSIQHTHLGLSYLVAGPGITIFTQSNGQIIIGSPWTNNGTSLMTTSSVSIDGQGRFPASIGSDVYFFVSGTVGIPSGTANARRVAVFGGDVRVSGSLTVGTGSVTVTSNDIQFGSGARIERSGNDLKFIDASNPTGQLLSSLVGGGGGGGGGPTGSFNLITTKVLDNVRANGVFNSAPVTNWTGSYTSLGNPAMVVATAVGYNSPGAGLVTLNLRLDGNIIASSSYYCNDAGIHDSLPAIVFTTSSISLGVHAFRMELSSSAIATADTNDYANLSVTEFVAGSSGAPVAVQHKQYVYYTGTTASFVVPEGVTSLKVKMWGAGAGNGAWPSNNTAGAGGFTSGTIQVTPGEQLFIIVGGGGQGTTGSAGDGGLGGWGGGGFGTKGDASGGGGGGYTGIFSGAIHQQTAILIAGGGGGGTGFRTGGGGGGLSGGSVNNGTGGTQTAAGGPSAGGALYGGKGTGQRTVSTANDDGGGGGGYFGGGGGSGDGRGGGGGSGFVHPTRVLNGATIAGESGNTSNTRANPPMTLDADYLSSAPTNTGKGGNTVGGNGTDGGHGWIVLEWTVGKNAAYFVEDTLNTAYITSSVAIGTASSAQTAAGQEAFFYVSGTIGVSGSQAKKTIFGGDVQFSGSLISSYFGLGALFPLTTPPPSASWINVSLDANTRFEVQDGGVLFLSSSAGASPSFKVAARTAPATPYTITACIVPLFHPGTTASVVGIGWRDSSTGRLATWIVYSMGSGLRVAYNKYNSPTSFNSSYFDVPGFLTPYLWMRLEDNGSTRRVGWSADGRNFFFIGSTSRTDFLTPDQVCIFVDPETIAAAMTVASWKVE